MHKNTPGHNVGVLFLSASGLFFLFLSYLFPLHLTPWNTFHNEMFFAVAVGVLFAITLLVNKKSFVDPRGWIVILILISIHFSLIGIFGEYSVDGLLIFVIYGFISYLAYSVGFCIRGGASLMLVLLVILFSATISAIVAVLQWSGIVSGGGWDPGFVLYSEGGGRVSSNIGQANNLGTLLVLGLAAVGYVWHQAPFKRILFRGLAASSVLLLVLGIYFSGSRTALLNLLLWPVLAFAWARWRRQPIPWLSVVPVVLLLVLHAAMPPLIEWAQWFPAQEARSLVHDSSRLRLWSMVLDAIGESPWLGQGFGAVAQSHLRLSPSFGSFDFSIASHAHNTILDLWAIFGLPLGSLIVLSVGWLWVQAWRGCHQPQNHFLWLMTTAMLVHSMLEYPLHYGFFLWLLFGLFGFLAAKPWKTVDIQRPWSMASAWLLVFMTVAIFIWLAYVQLERNYTIFRQYGSDVAHQALAERHFPLQKTLFKEPYERLWWLSTSVEDVLKLSDTELLQLEQTALHYPLPGLGWRMAFAQAARGNTEQATWWAERMCAMFDPRACRSASEEWGRRAAENPKWPALQWERWLPK